MQAFMTGKIKVEGDVSKLIELQSGPPGPAAQDSRRCRSARHHQVAGVTGADRPGSPAMTRSCERLPPRRSRCVIGTVECRPTAQSTPDERDGSPDDERDVEGTEKLASGSLRHRLLDRLEDLDARDGRDLDDELLHGAGGAECVLVDDVRDARRDRRRCHTHADP